MLKAVLAGDLEALQKEGAKVLKFRHVSTTTMRDATKTLILPELEFGLLKASAAAMNLGPKERNFLMDMFIDKLHAIEEHMCLEVTVRSLCHSRGVTADYLRFQERFKMKKSLLILGDVGTVESHWAQLIQPAVYFYQKEYNVVIMDSLTLGLSPQRWLQYGPSIIRGTLRHLDISQVSVFAMGLGSCIFYQILAQTPHLLSGTHIIYNQDMPDSVVARGIPFDIHSLEESLRDRDIQLWMMYNDEDDEADPKAYTRHNKGPQRLGELFLKMQARLESERKIQNSDRSYDEILVTEKLNAGAVRVEKLWVSRVPTYVFTEESLITMAHYLRQTPSSVQDDVQDGLVKDLLSYFREDVKSIMELPAVKNCLMDRSHEVRKEVALGNRRRLEILQDTALAITGPKVETLSLSRTGSLSRRGTGSKSAMKLRSKSNLTVVSEDDVGPFALEGGEDEDDSLFPESGLSQEDYRARWAALRVLKGRTNVKRSASGTALPALGNEGRRPSAG